MATRCWKNVWWYVWPFRHNTSVWRTDRQTDRQISCDGIEWWKLAEVITVLSCSVSATFCQACVQLSGSSSSFITQSVLSIDNAIVSKCAGFYLATDVATQFPWPQFSIWSTMRCWWCCSDAFNIPDSRCWPSETESCRTKNGAKSTSTPLTERYDSRSNMHVCSSLLSFCLFFGE